MCAQTEITPSTPCHDRSGQGVDCAVLVPRSHPFGDRSPRNGDEFGGCSSNGKEWLIHTHGAELLHRLQGAWMRSNECSVALTGEATRAKAIRRSHYPFEVTEHS